MHEQVITAVLRGNKSIPLLIAKPLHCTRCHFFFLLNTPFGALATSPLRSPKQPRGVYGCSCTFRVVKQTRRSTSSPRSNRAKNSLFHRLTGAQFGHRTAICTSGTALMATAGSHSADIVRIRRIRRFRMNIGTAPLSFPKDKGYRAIVEQVRRRYAAPVSLREGSRRIAVRDVYVNTLVLMRLAKSNADG